MEVQLLLRLKQGDGRVCQERISRICKQCQLSEIEDVTHWLLRCESQADSTALLVQKMMISVNSRFHIT